MDYWITENIVDHAATTITPSSSAGMLTAENLRDPRVSKVWRSDEPAGGGSLSINLAGPRTMSAIGVFGVDDDYSEGSGTPVQIKLGDTPGSSEVLDVEMMTQHGQAVWRAPVTVASDGTQYPSFIGGAYLTITLPFAREIGRVFAGAGGVYPQVGHIVNGSNWQMIDLSVRSVTPRNGAFLIDVADRRRVFTAAYDAINRDEMNQFDRLDRYIGSHQQVMFVPEPSVYTPLSNWSVLGYIRELPENQFLGHMRGTRTMSVVEAG